MLFVFFPHDWSLWVNGQNLVVGQTVEVVHTQVNLFVSLSNLCRELPASLDVLIEVVFPLVLLCEREFYLQLLQFCHDGLEVPLVECLQRRFSCNCLWRESIVSAKVSNEISWSAFTLGKASRFQSSG